MGTRNLTMVISEGKTKIAQYGQWDGYPGGQGLNVLTFLQNAALNKFKGQLEKCRFANTRTPKENYTMKYNSRDVCAGILDSVYHSIDDSILLVNNEEFIVDGLFCEWAYVIDLDTNVLQVYKGFAERKLTKDERFYHLQKRVQRKQKEEAKKAEAEGRKFYIRENDYCCPLLHEFKLDELPDSKKFIEVLTLEEDEN